MSEVLSNVRLQTGYIMESSTFWEDSPSANQHVKYERWVLRLRWISFP